MIKKEHVWSSKLGALLAQISPSAQLSGMKYEVIRSTVSNVLEESNEGICVQWNPQAQECISLCVVSIIIRMSNIIPITAM